MTTMAFSVRSVAPMQRLLVRSASSGTGRQGLAISAPSGDLPPPSSSTTGHYYAAPTCRSDRQRYRRPLACLVRPMNKYHVSPGIIPLPSSAVGVGTSSRLMSSSSSPAPQYFEGPWYEKYLLLEQYKKENGNCIVPPSFVYDDVKLGAWVSRQRILHKKGKLSHNRRALGFSWDILADQWERNFALLEQFKDREGHCDVPGMWEENDIKLGKWVLRQRQALKKGKLDESYQRRLEDLGFSWDPYGDQWERHFALLEEYKEREGNCDVPNSYEEDGIKLGAWLDTQRQVRKGNTEGNLGVERIQRLDEIGIRWSFKKNKIAQNSIHVN